MNKRYDVLVIGSGPSGIAAAVTAARGGKSVCLLERNEKTAKKIYASGNGHCNYLNKNSECFDTANKFCGSIGIVPVFEEDGRMYPRCMRASSVVSAFDEALKRAGVKVILNEHVIRVQKDGQGFVIESEGAHVYEADALVIACGGKAGIQFGCYGDGYKFAEAFGHKIVKPIPGLCGLVCKEDISILSGMRIKAKVGICANGKLLDENCGEVQFNKNYISGICVMNLSRYFRMSDDVKYTLHIDLYPEYSHDELLQLFASQIEKRGCAMEGLVPNELHDYLHQRIDASKHNPAEMAVLSKNLSFEIDSSKGWKDAQVTCGGVCLDELDADFRSKMIDNLYFVGEITDYDGPCGGYNIGYAVFSGVKAGEGILR